MRAFKIPGADMSRTPETPASIKRRLFFQGFLAVLVLGAIGTLFLKSQETSNDQLPIEDPIVSQMVDLPEVDAAALDALVADDRPEDRVLLERAAIDALAPTARNLTPLHVLTLEPTELDEEAIATLDARRHEARGEAFIARGYLADMEKRQRGSDYGSEYIGRLILEDESSVYFLVYSNPEELLIGDFARIDGLFLKMWSDEDPDEPGNWLEGPLLSAPKLQRSYADLGKVVELDPRIAMQIEDDVLMTEDGTPGRWRGVPQEGLWHLMAYARDLPEGAIDWDEAPKLNAEALQQVSADGPGHRFQAFRIPISRLQGIRTRTGVENAARVESFTTGWLGNTTWKNVVHFQMPKPLDGLTRGDHVTARGFFLSNFAYQSVSGMRTSPVFVLHSLDLHDPEIPFIYRVLAPSLVGVIFVLVGLFIVVLRRDGARAEALQRDMVRRRQQRRARNATVGSGSA